MRPSQAIWWVNENNLCCTSHVLLQIAPKIITIEPYSDMHCTVLEIPRDNGSSNRISTTFQFENEIKEQERRHRERLEKYTEGDDAKPQFLTSGAGPLQTAGSPVFRNFPACIACEDCLTSFPTATTTDLTVYWVWTKVTCLLDCLSSYLNSWLNIVRNEPHNHDYISLYTPRALTSLTAYIKENNFSPPLR